MTGCKSLPAASPFETAMRSRSAEDGRDEPELSSNGFGETAETDERAEDGRELRMERITGSRSLAARSSREFIHKLLLEVAMLPVLDNSLNVALLGRCARSNFDLSLTAALPGRALPGREVPGREQLAAMPGRAALPGRRGLICFAIGKLLRTVVPAACCIYPVLHSSLHA